jgi:hypothetical protein
MNEQVVIMQRDTMQILDKFGHQGRQPGQFYAVHSIALDSKGNIYTAETRRGNACSVSCIGALARRQAAGIEERRVPGGEGRTARRLAYYGA